MLIAFCTVTLYAPWVHSLKEKRSVVKRLCSQLQTKFNLSVAESDAQDVHQTIVVSMAALAAGAAQADAIFQSIERFILANTEAEITHFEREFR